MLDRKQGIEIAISFLTDLKQLGYNAIQAWLLVNTYGFKFPFGNVFKVKIE